MEEENEELSLSLSLSQSRNISSKSPSMAEPSKAEDQNPLDQNPKTSIDKPLTLKECSNTNSFSFQVYPAFKLSLAIYALTDSEFNKQGTAMIEVGRNAVELTVWNTETNVLGYLRLNVKGLIEFYFRKPLKRKMINLVHISQNLDLASDMDTVTISHVDGSSKLSYNFGTEPVRKFEELLLDIGDEFKKAPDIIFSCECILLREYLWYLLGLVEATNTNLVSFELTDSSVTLFVGKNRVQYEYDTKKGGTRGMEEGQRHHTWFQCPNCDALRKASLLTRGVLLCLVTDPNDSIMWRFNLRDLGDLAFVQKNAIVKFIPNFEPGTKEGGDSSTA